MDNCIFCKIAQGKELCTKIFEDKNTLAFLDIFPAAKGHTLVISKKHYTNVIDAPEKELAEIIKTIKKIGLAQVEGLKAHGFNIHQSNNKEAGQVVFHLHFHVIPRVESDELSFKWKPKENTRKEMEKTAKEIREWVYTKK